MYAGTGDAPTMAEVAAAEQAALTRGTFADLCSVYGLKAGSLRLLFKEYRAAKVAPMIAMGAALMDMHYTLVAQDDNALRSLTRAIKKEKVSNAR